MIGQISGMLDDIKTVKEIIDDIVNGIGGVVDSVNHKYA